MFLDSLFYVSAGDLIRATPWNLAGRAIDAMRLISGIGVRLRWTPSGTIINFVGNNAVFNNPFKVTLLGNESCTVRPGRINLVAGKIDKKPLEVDEGEPAPQLVFKNPLNLDKDGKGWIAAEVTCNKENWAVESWEVVQVADLDSPDGKVGGSKTASGSAQGGVPNLPGRRARQPLAMLRQDKTGSLRLFQITYFNLQHRVKLATQDPLVDAGRHFFFPQG